MAFCKIARFIFFSVTIVALFISHECVDGQEETPTCFRAAECIGHIDCWCCKDEAEICFDYVEQCINYCKDDKHLRKIVS
ncbi:hypothetical protein ACP275_08G149500 [Erythranthe tilingii]